MREDEVNKKTVKIILTIMRVSLKPLFNLHKLTELIHIVNTLLVLSVTFTKYFRLLFSRI